MTYQTYEGASSATLHIPAFTGLAQYGDGIGLDPGCAVEAKNALTTRGVLSPMARCTLLKASLPAPIETLARLHRRWHTQAGEHDVLIAACGGQLYWMLETDESWQRIQPPEGVSAYQSNHWSYVAYEMNPEGSDAPVDVLLLSNAYDGMICVRGDTMTAAAVPTPKKFGVIARHAERIWGGAILGDPDLLVYSAPYDPFNWSQNDAFPEDGAGDVMQPSWDGDSFTALTPFGSQLIALKRTRIWRILGTNPGEYAFKEQYGGGTPYADTVAVDGARILMLGREGVVCYDGESASDYERDFAKEVFSRMNPSALDGAFGCMHRGAYYLALPLDASAVNNAVLRYDTLEKTWLLREDVSVEAFLPTETALYFTSATTPGRLWQWREDAWEEGAAAPMRWVGPWCDLGMKNIRKGGFTLYLTLECRSEAALTLTMETERKAKTKTLRFQPPGEGRQPAQRRVRFGGSGRRFRLRIEAEDGVPWRLLGGVQIEAEIDID